MSSDLATVAILLQHNEGINALAIHGVTLVSASTKLNRTDLALLSGRGCACGGTIVASIDLEDANDKLKRFMQITKPKLDYFAKSAILLFTTIQLGSFAFNEATVPENKELHEALAWTRELGVSAEGLFPAMFVSACALDRLHHRHADAGVCGVQEVRAT